MRRALIELRRPVNHLNIDECSFYQKLVFTSDCKFTKIRKLNIPSAVAQFLPFRCFVDGLQNFFVNSPSDHSAKCELSSIKK